SSDVCSSDLSFILRLSCPGGKYGSPVVVGKILKGPADVRFITVGLCHDSLQVVGDQELGDTAQIFQAPAKGKKKVGGALGRDGHGKGVVRVRETGHKELAIYNLPCLPVNIGDGFARKINIEFLRGPVVEDH